MTWDLVEVDFLARVELDPTLERGRWGEYRPNHNLGTAENTDLVMGFMSIPEDKKLEPGEAQNLAIRFFVPPDYMPKLEVGRRWIIQEGRSRVGSGEILEVRGHHKH